MPRAVRKGEDLFNTEEHAIAAFFGGQGALFVPCTRCTERKEDGAEFKGSGS